ncbi:MAG: hypothetical protein AB2693_31375, partial [Candidatus Thiodiazotropha sp.]
TLFFPILKAPATFPKSGVRALGPALEPSLQDGSNEMSHYMFLCRNRRNLTLNYLYYPFLIHLNKSSGT